MKNVWLSTLFVALFVASPLQASLALQRGGIHTHYSERSKDKPKLKRLTEGERQQRRVEGRKRALERLEKEEKARRSNP